MNSHSFSTRRIAFSTLARKTAASYWRSTEAAEAAIQASSKPPPRLPEPRFWALRLSISSPRTCLAMARSHVEKRAPRAGS